MRKLARLIACLACLITGSAAANEIFAYRGPQLIEETVRIPSQDGSYLIAATVLRPDGIGPFGAVVFNHGVAVSAKERAAESPSVFIEAASEFARRGYVVVMPLRRGFGATGGAFAEDAGSCRNPDYMNAEQKAADDVMAAYEYTRRLPYVDGSRMILAGQSAGGFISIFTAGMRSPEGLIAVLSFAGGRGGNPNINPGVPCAIEPLAKVFDVLGPKVKVPVLFHYAENDLYFNPETTKLWYQRFTAGGARAEYVLQPAFGRDGHYLFPASGGARRWLPVVERFLGNHEVKFALLDASPGQPIIAKEPSSAPTLQAATPKAKPAGSGSVGTSSNEKPAAK